jgi:hypothetical protein
VKQITLEPELIVRRSCGYHVRGYTISHSDDLSR